MSEAVRAVLSGIQTVDDMIAAFSDEQQCRRLLEAMVWPNGRICPACGYKRSIAIAGRDMGRRRARPGLYQCSSTDCRFQFTATTHTPLHSTKLPLSAWLKALWLMLQSDKGLSSVRLAEALGVSQPTAWRMGHALRLMVARETPLGGTVEIDEFYLGGRAKKPTGAPPSGRGRKGQPRTTKKPVLAMVQRPGTLTVGAPAGDARAAVVEDLSSAETKRILEKDVEPEAHLMSDEWKAFIAVGHGFAAHMCAARSMPIPPRASMQGSAAPLPGSSTTSVRSTLISIFMRSVSDGLSASSRAGPLGEPEADGRPSKSFGNASLLRCNCRRSFRLQQVVKCAEPPQAASLSSRLSANRASSDKARTSNYASAPRTWGERRTRPPRLPAQVTRPRPVSDEHHDRGR